MQGSLRDVPGSEALGARPGVSAAVRTEHVLPWALHVDLHGKDTIATFLEQIDTYVDGFLAGAEDVAASYQMVLDLVVLDALRSQLRDFLRTREIRTDLTDDDALWSEFVKGCVATVVDGAGNLKRS